MNLRANYLVTGFLLAAAMAGGCGDEHEHGGDVAIHIASPTDGATVAAGESVTIAAHVEAEDTLHGWTVNVRNVADDSVLATFADDVHDAMFEISEDWTADVDPGTEVEIEFVVEIDHEGNTASESVSITVE